jgi:hypothetical protein
MTNEELVATLNQRFDQLDERFDQLETRMDDRFAQVEKEAAERYKRVNKRFDELGRDFHHQVRILVEDFKRRFGLLHDGIKIVDGKLGRFKKDTEKNLTAIRRRLLIVEAAVAKRHSGNQ